MKAAVEQHPSVRLFQERVTEAQGAADTQFGQLLPNISGRMSGTRRRLFFGSFGRAPIVADPDRLYETRALLTQNVFSLSLIQKWRAAKMGVEVAGLDAEVIKHDTMATVGLVYLETLRTQETAEAREADVALNQELLRLTSRRRKAGMATSLDVNRAHVRFKNARQRWLVAQNERDRATLNLLRAIGLSFDVNLVLTDTLRIVTVPEQALPKALKVAEENRSELKAQKRKERLAGLTLSSVQSERVPSLQASGDVGLIGNTLNNMLTNDNLQLMMTIPIFDGGQREGRISESRSRIRQEMIKTQDIRYQISLEVRDAVLSLRSAKQQVQEAEEGLTLALTEVKLARARFAVGMATNIEVTDAQASVAKARDNRIESLFNFNAARINLARAQGRLHDIP
ncbi:MAG: hypothetical protein NPIRA04_06070 [Nitrospirales bacterium]|nr:MAG: hypothetical protein NPIRA04_06070 [Nitrospirales bacterium]